MDEPKHKYWDLPASEWIDGYARRMPDEDVVGLWQIVIDGRRWFGLTGEALTDYVHRALQALVGAGARPLKQLDAKEHSWVPQPQYGSENAAIIDAVMAEWIAAGARDGDPAGLWFGVPQICDKRERRDGLERMLDVLHFLEQKKVHFFIERVAEDTLMATLTLVGARVEIYFMVEDMTFSVFKGDEGVILEDTPLYDLIAEHWGDD
jgi:hypothetical protein